ncbi:MAG: CCA tRNA nucleotidyltransferase [Desulfurococcales archaeon ex4484_58]|nr:MAG: CCA tRNA nucleotidyltransferase [Desulfurococcales archaeon ex4484_58]
MNIFDSIEKQVLEKIKPKPEEYELLHSTFHRIKDTLEKILNENNVDAKVTLQGSVAHDTWLSGDHDLDVFVLFNKKYSVNELRNRYFKLLLEGAKRLGNIELRYAQHPYVRVLINDVEADIVPAYELDDPSEIRFAVDRTPFHTRYVNSKLNDKLRDQIRLLKKFMKNIGVYGAEIKVRGFSGYVVELLIIVYKSFRETLERISKQKPPVYIKTIDDRDFRKVIRDLKRKYPDSVVFIPDPVDPFRNAGANISIESLSRFAVASHCYLKNPSTKYFFKPAIQIDQNNMYSMVKNRCLVSIEISLEEKLPPDILWGELYRLADRATKVLLNNDFNVIDWRVWSDEVEKAIIVLEVDHCVKENPRIHRGPEYWYRERVLDYIKKHIERGSIGPWIGRDGTLTTLGKRKFREVDQLLIERSWEYMVTPHFKNKKPVVRTVDEKLIKEYCRDKGVCEWLLEVILKRPYWMLECIG